MKHAVTIFVFISLYLSANVFAYCQLNNGYQSISPDKTWTLTINKGFADISKNGSAPQHIQILPCVFEVIWSDDSKLILLVQHIAGGKIAGIFHLTNDNWVLNQVEAPVKFRCSYAVLHAKFNFPKIVLIYKVSKDTTQGSTNFYLCNFVFDASDGTTSQMHLTPISVDEYIGKEFTTQETTSVPSGK